MKRLMAMILCLCMLAGIMAGCTKEPAENKPAENQQNEPANTNVPANSSEPIESNSPAAETEALYGGTLVAISTSGNPGSFNPVWKSDDPATSTNHNIFNKLVTLNYNYEICPDLAESWEISDDGLTYTFHLYENVKWHDGEPFSSEDVKFTIETVLENKGRMAIEWSAIESIDCPDANTVILHLSQPDAALLGFLAWYACQIIPKHIYEGTDWTTNPANQAPIGTGPFKFVEWNQGVSVTLEANEDYFKGRPYVDKLVIQFISDANTAEQALLNGEADYMLTSPPLSDGPALEANADMIVVKPNMPSRYYIGFNFGRELTGNIKVREAISMAINQEEIVQRAFNGYGKAAEGYFTPAFAWAYNDEDVCPAYDPDAANALLDEAGYPIAYNGYRFSLDLVNWQNQGVSDMSAVIKEQLKAVGIEVNIITLEMGAWTPRVKEDFDFDMAITNGFHGPDPHNLYSRIATDASNKILGPYSNEELDNTLKEAVKVSDQTKRGELYKYAQKLMHDDYCIVPLAEYPSFYVYSAKLDGTPLSEEGKAAGLSFNSFTLTRFNDPSMINN